MINPIDTAGSLTYGKGDAKHSNGRLFRFLTGSPYHIDKQYSVSLRAVTARAISRSRGMRPTQTVTAKKLQQPYTGPLQPFFRNKKPQAPYLQTLVFLPHLSSSSDLRILSSTQPSQVSPMTDFRQVWRLHAYSGGTVRDSHPVFYSLAVLLPHPQALKRNIYLHSQYTRLAPKSQSQKEKTLIYDTNRNINH